MSTDILRRIVADKVLEVRRGGCFLTLADLQRLADRQTPPRDFINALRECQKHARLPVIAEIKKRSPSRGLLRESFSPVILAKEYEDGGAACLSVLTDRKYFGGGNKHLRMAKAAVSLPVLRKDFIIDEWQIAQSRAMGADAILLIAALLNVEKMQTLTNAATQKGMAVLIETHDDEEVNNALQIPNAIIGINNRNLRTFVVDINTSARLIPQIKKADPTRIIVAESGIKTNNDIQKLKTAHAYLIGETLMRADNPGKALKELFSP